MVTAPRPTYVSDDKVRSIGCTRAYTGKETLIISPLITINLDKRRHVDPMLKLVQHYEVT